MVEAKEVYEALRTQARALRLKGEEVTIDVLEHLMLHLEALDDNFHRFMLVKLARTQLSEFIRPFLDDAFEKLSQSEGEHEAVYQTVQRILSSPQYAELKKQLLEVTQISVANVNTVQDVEIENVEEDFLEGGDSDDDTELDDLGESFFGLLPPGHELRRMVKNMGAQYPPETRLDALRGLVRLSPGDLIVSEHWSQVKIHLRTALLDVNTVVFREALLFHLRLFNTGILGVMREIFLHFVAHMQAMVQAGLVVPAGPRDAEDSAIRRIVLQAHVLNTMAARLPRFWLRFGERGLMEVVDAALGLFFPTDGAACALAPYTAVCDPRASWFSKWMSGNFSRQHVFEFFKRNEPSLRCLASSLAIFQQHAANAVSRPRTALAQCPHSGGAENFVYSDEQLGYLCAMHNVCIIGELLLYSRGRSLFPIESGSGGEQHERFTVQTVMTELARILCSDLRSSIWEEKAFFQPGVLAADLIKRIISYVMPSQLQLLDTAAMMILTEPILAYTTGKFELARLSGEKETLLDIADIFGLMAMSAGGRQLLLSRLARGGSVAAVVASFVIKAFACVREQASNADILLDFARAFLFVCRQIYNTHEGLLVLSHLSLHAHIAEALNTVSKNTAWEELLTDSLMNFAWTPRGASLLGTLPAPRLHSCVARMFDRFRANVQVSKYEKFGYGVLVAELSSSLFGMSALLSTGFVDFVTTALVEAAEVHVDYTVPGDLFLSKGFRKAVGYAMTVLTSLAAVKHIAREGQSATPLTAILRSLVLDTGGPFSCGKDHFDFVRLHILHVLTACLDNFLLCEVVCGLTARLLQWQSEHCVSEGAVRIPIVDLCSLLRNRILVSTQMLGGPRERVLPPLTIDDDCDPPLLFLELPVPSVYALHPGDQVPHILDAAVSDPLQRLRGAMAAPVAYAAEYYIAWAQQLSVFLPAALATVAGSGVALPAVNITPKKSVEGEQSLVSKIDLEGARCVCRYAVRIGLIAERHDDFFEGLRMAVSGCRAGVPGAGEYLGFDWFASSVFIICGNAETTCSLLSRFTARLSSATAWPLRLPHRDIAYGVISHWVSHILHAELPLVAGAMRLSGLTCARVCLQWLQQCFWNVLDWSEISNFVALSLLEDPGFPVYYCVAVFRHIQEDILRASQQQRLAEYLHTGTVEFALASHLGFIAALKGKYEALISADLRAALALQ